MNNKSTRIPAAPELIEAVAEFLEQELLPTLDGSQQFNTRVSINALRIVRRELNQAVPDEAELLELAAKIRTGKIDENDPTLLALLRRHTLERLAVDNPKYSSYVAARERGE